MELSSFLLYDLRSTKVSLMFDRKKSTINRSKLYETFARPPQNLTDFENRHFFEVNLAFGSFLAEYLSF